MVTPNYIRELLRYYKKKQTSLRVIISVEGSLLIKNILTTVALGNNFLLTPVF